MIWFLFVLRLVYQVQPECPHAIPIAAAIAGATDDPDEAALILATADDESHLDPLAVGDGGTSVCIMQVSVSNAAYLETTRERMQNDLRECVRAGLRMMRLSARMCRSRPADERQAHYLAGGGDCVANEVALRHSKSRTRRAWRLLRRTPQ